MSTRASRRIAATAMIGCLLAPSLARASEPASTFQAFTEASLGPAAMLVRVQSLQPVNCHTYVSVAGYRPPGRALTHFVSYETNGAFVSGYQFSFAEQGQHVYFEGLYDSRSAWNAAGRAATSSERDTSFSGVLEITIGGTHVEPWPAATRPKVGPGSKGESLSVEMSCTGPVTVTLKGAHEILILDPRNGRTGAGVFHQSVGSAVVDQRLAGRFTSPQVRLRSVSFTYQAGWLTHDSPEGHAEHFVGFSGFGVIFIASEHTPGMHSLELDRVGLAHAFWAALMGLHNIEALDQIAALPALK